MTLAPPAPRQASAFLSLRVYLVLTLRCSLLPDTPFPLLVPTPVSLPCLRTKKEGMLPNLLDYYEPDGEADLGSSLPDLKLTATSRAPRPDPSRHLRPFVCSPLPAPLDRPACQGRSQSIYFSLSFSRPRRNPTRGEPGSPRQGRLQRQPHLGGKSRALKPDYLGPRRSSGHFAGCVNFGK